MVLGTNCYRELRHFSYAQRQVKKAQRVYTAPYAWAVTLTLLFVLPSSIDNVWLLVKTNAESSGPGHRLYKPHIVANENYLMPVATCRVGNILTHCGMLPVPYYHYDYGGIMASKGEGV